MSTDPPKGDEPPLAVRVPDPLRPAFEHAQGVVHDFFSRRSEEPWQGSIEISGERYLLMRAGSLSTEFFAQVTGMYRDQGEEKARAVTHGMLFDIAYAIGKADAKNFHTRMGLVDPIEKLSAGPIHFAYAGWSLVDIHPASHPSPDDDFFLLYDHPYSFEADTWLRQGKETDFPVCVMNSGYSSGWCDESFGVSLVSVEVSCRAAGAERCRFVMAPPSRIQGHLERSGMELPGADDADAHVPEFFRRKRLEDELRRHHEDLEQRIRERTRELREANEGLVREASERARAEAQLRQVQKMEALGTLAGGVAHDFNNLLTAIMGGLQLAELDAKPGSDVLRVLRNAQKAARRAAELTRQLLTLSRKQPSEIRPVDANEVVETIIELLEHSIAHDVTIVVDLTDEVVPLALDEGKLQQALLNLGINAADAMPGGGRLSVRTRRVVVGPEEVDGSPDRAEGPHLRIDVKDTGTGIPASVLEHVFEPFFTTKEVGKGTGLGLAMVYGCMRDHGGWVTVESAVGRGTCVSCFIPWRPFRRPGARREGRQLPSGTERVLLVDDADTVRSLGRAILTRCGYDTLTARTGQEALTLFDQLDPSTPGERIDIVVTDMVMPEIGGKELLAALRRRGYEGPVVLASAYWSEATPEPVAGADFAALLPKPFGAQELARKVREVLDEAKRGGAEDA